MNKHELTAVLAEKLGLSLKESGYAIDDLLESITEALVRGEEVKLAGFGTLKVRVKAARKGTIPGSGTVIDIPEKKTISFKPSKSLKEKI